MQGSCELGSSNILFLLVCFLWYKMWNLVHWYLQIYSSLQYRVGHRNQSADGFSWTVLRCFNDDQKFNSAQRLALRAECNSKLAVGLIIMQESFQSMKDPRTGIDMIPQVLYNWGWAPAYNELCIIRWHLEYMFTYN